MREILFRGKSLKTGEWIEGDLEFNKEGRPAIRFWRYKGSPAQNYGGDYVDPDTIGQFTGLYDGYGCRIFEGDVVYTPSFFGISEKTWVTFRDGAFGVEWPHGETFTFQAFTSFVSDVIWEVKGNIHGTPIENLPQATPII